MTIFPHGDFGLGTKVPFDKFAGSVKNAFPKFGLVLKINKLAWIAPILQVVLSSKYFVV